MPDVPNHGRSLREQRTGRTRDQFVCRLLAAACGVVVAIQWIVIWHRRAQHLGDFDVSREFGRRFLAGEPLYAGGLNYQYLPTAGLYYVPLALLPSNLGLALRYAIAVACLWLTLRMLHTMTRELNDKLASHRCGVSALTLVLGSQYIIRDLDDGGPHLILLTMLVAGIYSVWKGAEWSAAVWFGLAAALKAPAGLFLPFLLWKRHWRTAIYTTLATVGWVVLPALWMGPATWWSHQGQWARVAGGSVVFSRSVATEEFEDRVQNQSLRSALVQDLASADGRRAKQLAVGAMLGLVVWCGWQMRQPYQSRGRDAAWLVDSSAVLLLIVLLSPVTWIQHLVFAVPALYLIVSEAHGIRKLGSRTTAALGVYVLLALLLNREVVGRPTHLVLLAYHTHTVAMLLLLAVILLRRPTDTSA